MGFFVVFFFFVVKVEHLFKLIKHWGFASFSCSSTGNAAKDVR